jgi:G3E family GTPase
MKIILLSGFLGSGKTTSVIRIGRYLKSKGYSVAVLVNDVGDVGVDGQVISENGLESKEMPRGCICCTLRYALEANIALVQAQYDPDVLLIEPTGVAFPQRIKEQIEKMDFGPEVSMGPIISILDGSKFDVIMKRSRDSIVKQTKDADIILLNKKDLMGTEKLSGIISTIDEMNPNARLFSLSLKEEGGAFQNLMDILEVELQDVIPHSGVKSSKEPCSFDTPSGGSCAVGKDDDFDHFNVSSYAESYDISSSLDKETATNLALDVMRSIKSRVIQLNPAFLGHLKMFLQTEAVSLRVSVTSFMDDPEVELISTNGAEKNKFTVFAAVTDIARDDLADIVEGSVFARSGGLGISA